MPTTSRLPDVCAVLDEVDEFDAAGMDAERGLGVKPALVRDDESYGYVR